MLKQFTGIFIAACAAWAPQLLAQGYPTKPIRVVVGYAPGGSADAGIRPLAKALEPLLDRKSVV
jgi:tripartite-type tricarboxylate transporter receptor subunit TctC